MFFTQDCKSLSKQIQARAREISTLKSECAQRKKLIEQQQECINKGKNPADLHKVLELAVGLYASNLHMSSHKNKISSGILLIIWYYFHDLNVIRSIAGPIPINLRFTK